MKQQSCYWIVQGEKVSKNSNDQINTDNNGSCFVKAFIKRADALYATAGI